MSRDATPRPTRPATRRPGRRWAPRRSRCRSMSCPRPTRIRRRPTRPRSPSTTIRLAARTSPDERVFHPSSAGSPAEGVRSSMPRRRGTRPDASALEAEDGRSLGEMLSAVTTNVSTLMQQEMALAKAELQQSGREPARASACSPVPPSPGCCSWSSSRSARGGAWDSSSRTSGRRWSWPSSGRSWPACLAMVGKKEFDRIRGIPQTTETLSKVPNALKGHERRREPMTTSKRPGSGASAPTSSAPAPNSATTSMLWPTPPTPRTSPSGRSTRSRVPSAA